MPVNFRVSDGPTAAPWLSPDIEPGQAQAGAFTVVAQLTQGDQYDFRVTVHNDGNEGAVPWTESTATGAFIGPIAGSGGLAWPLTGQSRTIATAPAGATRVQLVPQGTYYGLELQTSAGATIKVLASTLDPGFVDRRVAITYSPNGRHVILLDYNRGSGTASVEIFVALAGGGVAAGAQIMGSGSVPSVPSFSAFLPNLTFVAQWNQTEFAGLNFTFVPEFRGFFLTWRTSSIDIQYAVLDLRDKPRNANRVSIGNLARQNVGRHLFSPAGDVFALIPTQVNNTVELFELPSGQPLPIATNGYASGPLRLSALAGQLTVVNASRWTGAICLPSRRSPNLPRLASSTSPAQGSSTFRAGFSSAGIRSRRSRSSAWGSHPESGACLASSSTSPASRTPRGSTPLSSTCASNDLMVSKVE